MQAASTIAIASAGFLLAVLWMDLMFDVQVLPYRRDAQVPEQVLASIAGYYRRVTTNARPMGHLIGAVMVTALIAFATQLVLGPGVRLVDGASLVLLAGPVLLAIVRVLPNAVRLGARIDASIKQSVLARSICNDHLLCFAGIFGFIVLRVIAVGA